MAAPHEEDAHGGIMAHSVDMKRVEASRHLLDCYRALGEKQRSILVQVRRADRQSRNTIENDYETQQASKS